MCDPDEDETEFLLRISTSSSSKSHPPQEEQDQKQCNNSYTIISPSSSPQLPTSCPEIQQQENGNLGGRLWQAIETQRVMHPSTGTKQNKWTSLLLGQIIALIATSQNASSFTLEFGMGRNFPLFLMFNAYFLLAMHLVLFHDQRRPEVGDDEEDIDTEIAPHSPSRQDNKREMVYSLPFISSIQLRVPWWSYLCLSILDVAPNYMTLMALKYTSLTSTTLLGSLTVPSAMLACRFLLKKGFQRNHYIGIIVCMVGGSLTIWADLDRTLQDDDAAGMMMTTTATTTSHPHSHIGDMFAVAAAIFYGFGDAVGEFWIKHVDRNEYLGMIGLFGCIYCLLLFPFSEGREVLSLFLDATTRDENFLPTLAVMLWYIASIVGFYICTTWFLLSADATLLIISLQTSNLWAILFAVLAYRDKPPPLFYLALVLVVGGVMFYELWGDSNSPPSRQNSFMSSRSNCSSQCDNNQPQQLSFRSEKATLRNSETQSTTVYDSFGSTSSS